jgi:superfamily II DNA or RNA helicase
MNLKISNKLHLTEMPGHMAKTVMDRLIFLNPKYLEAERMGRYTGNLERELKCYDFGPDGELVVPRGFTGQVVKLATQSGVGFMLDDERQTLPRVDIQFKGRLRPFQENAVAAMMNKEFGTLWAPTGSGKTVMALAIIAVRRQPTLIVVHTKDLMEQWSDRIETFLGIPADEIGVIGGGKKTVGKKITVATAQTLFKCADDVSNRFGHLVVDECHRAPSRTFTEAVTAFDCRYMLGLTATPWRRDKLSRLIFWYVGDIQHQVNKNQLLENGDILPVEVITRKTDFKPWHDPSTEYAKMLTELTQAPGRNRLIAEDVAAEANNGSGICLVLSDRKAHCEAIQNTLRGFGIKSELLTGGVPAKQRQQVIDRLNQGVATVVCATGQLIGEGFDCKGLSTLFLATPIKFDGRVIQYLGRVLRPAPGKTKAVVYDYVDYKVGPLVAAAKARGRVYNEMIKG